MIERKWKDGDRIELELPMATRLEPVDAHHQKTVALLYGPLVLFAISENEISPTASDLLGVIRADQRTWELRNTTTAVKMIPFTEIRDDQYTTYFNVIQRDSDPVGSNSASLNPLERKESESGSRFS